MCIIKLCPSKNSLIAQSRWYAQNFILRISIICLDFEQKSSFWDNHSIIIIIYHHADNCCNCKQKTHYATFPVTGDYKSPRIFFELPLWYCRWKSIAWGAFMVSPLWLGLHEQIGRPRVYTMMLIGYRKTIFVRNKVKDTLKIKLERPSHFFLCFLRRLHCAILAILPGRSRLGRVNSP